MTDRTVTAWRIAEAIPNVPAPSGPEDYTFVWEKAECVPLELTKIGPVKTIRSSGPSRE